MNTIKKHIFLSNSEKNNSMAIVTFEKKQQNIFCTLKTYNFPSSNNLILGIKCKDKVIKQNILLNNNLYSFVSNDIDLDSTLGCVLLSNEKENIVPLLWGSEKNENYRSQIINNLRSSIQKIQQKTVEKSQEKIVFTEEKQLENTKESIDTSCVENEEFISPIARKETYETYKNPFNINNYKTDDVSQISLEEETIPNIEEIAQVQNVAELFDSSEEEIDNIIDNNVLNKNGKDHKFYNMIADQLEEIFDKYPHEYNLEKLIENSKWAKIKHDEEDKYYVVGIIYVDNDIRYICYGVPGSYYTEPPIELRGYSQWLPADSSNPYEIGYWVMYQDSNTGENIYIN